MNAGFDTLRAADVLTQAGIDRAHARAIVAMMSGAIGEHVATTSDIAGVKTEINTVSKEFAKEAVEVRTGIAELKTDVAGLKTGVAGLKTDVAELKTDVAGLKTEVAAVRTEVAESKAALTWRIVLALGVFAALTRIMP